jgi:hypothetical protein
LQALREKSFLGYLIPDMLNPRKSHMVNARPSAVPRKAPFELQKGTNKPKKKSPNMGPPMILYPNKGLNLVKELI